MQLTIFNGSPRGKGGNTALILEHFLKGFMETPGNDYTITYLLKAKETAKLTSAFFEAEAALVAFPLYVDSMPARVKDFFEVLEPLCNKGKNPAIKRSACRPGAAGLEFYPDQSERKSPAVDF